MTPNQVLELDFPTQPRRKTVWIVLAILIAWGFGLRLWYATPELDSTRFWDERYGLENLEPLLKEGRLRPVHGFHPGFSYLPHGLVLKSSDLLFKATGWQRLAIFDGRGQYTATTYMICRTVSVVFGTLTLILLYLIGSRMGGARLGLLAAFLLSVVPWHLRQSVLFKADITLLFTVVLTFYLSLRAIDRPSVRSFATTGLSIGLALSSKFNAGPVAVPLTVGAFLGPGSKRRALTMLVGAAVVSVLVFLALQPFIIIDPEIYRRSMGSTSRVYERVAAREGHGRLYLFWHLVETLVSGSFHGPIIGGLAIVGLAAVTTLALRQRRESDAALPWLMVVSYIVAYTSLYALATPRPSAHNWLPISPFAALGAAWAIWAMWLWISARVEAKRWRAIGATTLAGIVLILAVQASSYTYRETVPSTGDRVLELLRARVGSPDGRHIITEHDFGNLFQTRHRRGRLALDPVDHLSDLSPTDLDLSDAEIFLQDRLDSPTSADFYGSRLADLPEEQVIVIEPRLFHAWGPPLVALLHPWRFQREDEGVWIRSPDDPRVFTARLPEADSGRRRLSIVLTPPRRTQIEQILVGNRPLKYIRFRGPRRQMPLTTIRLAAAPEILVTTRKGSPTDSFPFAIRTWRKPGNP